MNKRPSVGFLRNGSGSDLLRLLLLGTVVVVTATSAGVHSDPNPLRATLNSPDDELLDGIGRIADEIDFCPAFAERVTPAKALALYDRVVLAPGLTGAERVTALSLLVRAVQHDPITDMIANLAVVDLQAELIVYGPTPEPAPSADLPADLVAAIATYLDRAEADGLTEPGPIRPRCPPPFDRLYPRNDDVADWLLRSFAELVDDRDAVLGLVRYGVRLPPMTTPSFPTPTKAAAVPLFRPGAYGAVADLVAAHAVRGRCDLAEALVRSPTFKQQVQQDADPLVGALITMIAADGDADDFFVFLAHPHETPLAGEIPNPDRAKILNAAIVHDRVALLPAIFAMFRGGFFALAELGDVLLEAVFSRDPEQFAARIALFKDLGGFWPELLSGPALGDWLGRHFSDAYLHVFQFLLEFDSLYGIQAMAMNVVQAGYRHEPDQKKVYRMMYRKCPRLKSAPTDRPWVQAVMSSVRSFRTRSEVAEVEAPPAEAEAVVAAAITPDDSSPDVSPEDCDSLYPFEAGLRTI